MHNLDRESIDLSTSIVDTPADNATASPRAQPFVPNGNQLRHGPIPQLRSFLTLLAALGGISRARGRFGGYGFEIRIDRESSSLIQRQTGYNSNGASIAWAAICTNQFANLQLNLHLN